MKFTTTMFALICVLFTSSFASALTDDEYKEWMRKNAEEYEKSLHCNREADEAAGQDFQARIGYEALGSFQSKEQVGDELRVSVTAIREYTVRKAHTVPITGEYVVVVNPETCEVLRLYRGDIAYAPNERGVPGAEQLFEQPAKRYVRRH